MGFYPRRENREMQFDHFLARTPYEQLFAKDPKGIKYMRYKKNPEDIPKSVKTVFDANLIIASKYVNCSMTIECKHEFQGHSILINSGAVKEQRIHTDNRFNYSNK